jgi:putative aldouronate transport system substrate-binding protein
MLLAILMVVSLFAACGQEAPATTPDPAAPNTVAPPPSSAPPTPIPDLVDRKFTTTRHITVEIFNRNNDGGTKPEDNMYTDFIKEGMLREHNVDVTFVPIGRWSEVDDINNLLAAGNAPDVCVTYSYPTIQTYAGMGGVLNMEPYLTQYKDQLPNLWNLLGDTNIYYNQDPTYKTIWAIEARLAVNNRINTFVRQDWLTKLNIKAPTTLAEFEAMLVAFKDNASTLLGADADKMVPFSISFDIGWRANNLMISKVPSNISDKELYIHDFDDRQILYPGIKEGIRVLNKWYNMDLIWKDFYLYGSGDPTEDNMMKAGYVGSFMHNWDYPYRNADDGISGNLHKLVGPDAEYIAVDPFESDNGAHRKLIGSTVDRKVFFPATNDEPVASLFYLDFISKLENRMYLQIGDEGVTHKVHPDGTVEILKRDSGDPAIMNSPSNIDYTILINGLDLGDLDKTVKSIALSYPGVDPAVIRVAYDACRKDAFSAPHFNVGTIQSESGMGPPLAAKRDAFLNQAVVAPVDQFDAVFDAGMADYLASGGQAIIDERTAAYEKYFGK